MPTNVKAEWDILWSTSVLQIFPTLLWHNHKVKSSMENEWTVWYHVFLTGVCIIYLHHSCDRIPNKKYLKDGRLYSVSQCDGTVHCGRDIYITLHPEWLSRERWMRFLLLCFPCIQFRILVHWIICHIQSSSSIPIWTFLEIFSHTEQTVCFHGNFWIQSN